MRTMILIFVTALLSICGAAKLDRSYLPPISAKTAGGSSELLVPPVETSVLPTGSYVNDNQGVVVDAVTPGTRTSGPESTGLGKPRISYGSTNSKVGDAAFRESLTGFGNFGGSSIATRIPPAFSSIVESNKNSQEAILKIVPGVAFELPTKVTGNDESAGFKESYSYGFQTDKHISVGDNGVTTDDIKVNGRYSYKNDDGKVYSVSYTGGKDGYKPHVSHLPTPPATPDEIVKSLEGNTKDKTEGIFDNGSYDAQKYNTEDDYSSTKYNSNHRQSTNVDAAVSGSLKSQINQVVLTNSGTHSLGTHTHPHHNIESSQEHINSGSLDNGYGIKYTTSTVKEETGIQNEHVNNFGQDQFETKPQLGFHKTIYKGLRRKTIVLPQTTLNHFSNFGDRSDTSDAGDSSATAIASTGNNQELPNLQSRLGSTASVGNIAFSSASATGNGIANAMASTSPDHQSFKNLYPTPDPYSQLQTGSIKDANYGASSSILGLNQKQGSDSSYFYNQPAKSFTAPVLKIKVSKFSSNQRATTSNFSESSSTQQTSNLVNKPNQTFINSVVPTQSGNHQDYTSSLFYNGITQASALPFSSNHFESQNFKSNLTPSQSETSQKPAMQVHEDSQQVHDSQLQYGTIYEYNKPSSYKVTSTSGHLSHTGIQTKPSHSTYDVRDTQIDIQQVKPFDSSSIQKTKLQSSSININENPEIVQGTGSSQIKSFGNSQVDSFSQIGQALSTTSSQFGKKSNSQSSKSETQFDIGSSSTGKVDSHTSAQQNLGTLYDYHKPDENVSTHTRSQFSQGSSSISGIRDQNIPLNRNPLIVKSQSTDPFNLHSDTESSKSTNFGTTVYQSSQNKNNKHQFKEQTNIDKQYYSNSQSEDSSLKKTAFGGTSRSQIGQKHLHSLGNTGTLTKVQPISQFAQKRFGAQSNTGTFQSAQLGSSTAFQFGQNTDTKEQSLQQTTSSVVSPTTSGSTFGSQFGQKPLSGPGSNWPHAQPFTQFPQKPFGTQSATGTFQSTQLGSSTVSQFGQNTGIKGQKTTNVAQKPLESSDTVTSDFSQTAFDGTFGSQFGNAQLASIESNTDTTTQAQTGSAFEPKPIGSQSTSGVSQSIQSENKGQSSQQATDSAQTAYSSSHTTTSRFSQTALGSTSGSQIGQKHSHSLGTAGTLTKVQPISQFAQKRFGAQSNTGTFQSAQLGSSTASHFGQNTDTKEQSLQQTTSSVVSPTTSGSTFGSQFGQKPLSGPGSTWPHAQPITQFPQKPFGTQSATGTFQSIQLGSSTVSQFGQNTGIKGQKTTNLAQKPLESSHAVTSDFLQTTFEGTFGSQSGKAQLASIESNTDTTTQAQTGSAFEPKPIVPQSTSGVSQSIQSENKGQSSQQATDSAQTAYSSSHTTTSRFSQTALGSTSGSQIGQKHSHSLGTGGTLTKVQPISQFAQKRFGAQSNTGTFQSAQLGSSTASHFEQNTDKKEQSLQQTTSSVVSPNTSGSTFGSQFGQKPLSGPGSTWPQAQPIIQFPQKPFGTQSTTGTFQSTQLGSSTVSQFGQNTGIKGQKTTNLAQKPLESSHAVTSDFSQTAFDGTFESQSGKAHLANIESNTDTTTQAQTISAFGPKPIGSQSTSGVSQSIQSENKNQSSEQATDSAQTVYSSSHTTTSRFSQTALGSSSGSQIGQKHSHSLGTAGTLTKVQPISQFAQKRFGAQSNTGIIQSAQLSSSTASQFGQNTSTKEQSLQQTTSSVLSPTTSGSTFGSQFEQKPLPALGSTWPHAQPITQFPQKLFGTQSATGTFQSTQLGSSTVSQFGQNTGIKGQKTTNLAQKPLESSHAVTSDFSQTAFDGTFGSQSEKAQLAIIEPNTDTTTQAQTGSAFEPKTIGSQSTSGVSQSIQSENKGQSSQQATDSAQTAYSSSHTTTSRFSQTALGSTSGSQIGQKHSHSLGTAGTLTKVQPISQFAQKRFGAQSNTGTFQSAQLGSSTASQFGQNTDTEEQSLQQTTSSVVSPTTSGSTFGSQFGQKPLSGPGSTWPHVQPITQFPQKPFGTQSATGTFQSTQLGSSTVSQFGQNTGIEGQKTTNLAQKPLESSHAVTSDFSQTAFDGKFGSQSGKAQLASIESNTDTTTQAQTGSAFEPKTIGSQSTSGVSQSIQSENKGQSSQQATDSAQTAYSSSHTTTSRFSQTALGSTSGSQIGQKHSHSLGTAGTLTKVQPISQFAQKRFGAQSNTGTFQSAQLGSSTASQFGQNTDTKEQSLQQTTSSVVSPTTSGSTFGSQFGQKPLSGPGSTWPHVQPITQFPQKPFGTQSATGTFQSTQLGSSTVSQFGQNTGIEGQKTTNLAQKPLESSHAVTSDFSQTAFDGKFGSQSGKAQLASIESNTDTTTQAQTGSAFEPKPIGSQSTSGVSQSIQSENKGQSSQQATESAQTAYSSSHTTTSRFSQNALGSTSGSQIGQKHSHSLGTAGTLTKVQPISQFAQKRFGAHSNTGTFQSAQLGSSTASQFSQNTNTKEQSLQQTTSSVVSPTTSGSTFGSQFGQKPLSSLGSTWPHAQPITQFPQKPFGTQSATETFQSTQLGSSTVSQFGQNTGIKGQKTTNLAQKPLESSHAVTSDFSQTAFDGKFGSQSGKAQLSSIESNTDTTTQAQTGSAFEPKPIGSQSTSGVSQSIQSENKGQSSQQTTDSTQKAYSSSHTTTSKFSQTALGSTSGSQIEQKHSQSVETTDTLTKVPPISQFAQKRFGAQSNTGTFQLGSSTASQFGQNTDIKEESLQQTTSSVVSPTISGITFGSQFGQNTLSSLGTTASQVEPISQFAQKPYDLQSTTGLGSSTVSQFGQDSGNKKQKTTDVAQKLFDTSHAVTSGFSQTFFDGTIGSQLEQKPHSTVEASLDASPHVQTVSQSEQQPFDTSSPSAFKVSSSATLSSKSHFDTQVKTPIVTLQKPFLSNFRNGQLAKNTASAFASSLGSSGDTQINRVSKYQFSQFGNVGTRTLTPFSISQSKPTYISYFNQDSSSKFEGENLKPIKSFSSLRGFEKSLSTVGSTQFGGQPTLSTVKYFSKSQTNPSTLVSFEHHQSPISSYTFDVQPPSLVQQSIHNSGSVGVESLKSNGFGSFVLESVGDHSKLGSTVSTAQIPTANINKEQLVKSFVASKDTFESARNRPKFYANTRYHY